MIEKWLDVIAYQGQYQVSNLGRVRSLARVVKTQKGSRTYKGRILSLAAHSQGYLVVNLRSGRSGGKVFYVHRLVAAAFLGLSKLQVNHKDLNTKNNHLDNLEYVSNFENSLHAFKKGVKIGKTRLNAGQRKEIRRLRAKGVKLKVLAKKFNMSESAISEVARKTTWSWE